VDGNNLAVADPDTDVCVATWATCPWAPPAPQNAPGDAWPAPAPRALAAATTGSSSTVFSTPLGRRGALVAMAGSGIGLAVLTAGCAGESIDEAVQTAQRRAGSPRPKFTPQQPSAAPSPSSPSSVEDVIVHGEVAGPSSGPVRTTATAALPDAPDGSSAGTAPSPPATAPPPTLPPPTTTPSVPAPPATGVPPATPQPAPSPGTGPAPVPNPAPTPGPRDSRPPTLPRPHRPNLRRSSHRPHRPDRARPNSRSCIAVRC
jgi:hypothetical protein